LPNWPAPAARAPLALAVGTGLQVLQTLAEDVARLVGPKGHHNPAAARYGTAARLAR
jgi:hypothetical protein